jgi:glycosyltransferase involved in cell wall biosynthesis
LHVIAQAPYQANLFKARFGRTCDAVIPNFQPVPAADIRKSHPVKVVWLANVKAIKRPALFVELARAFEECRDVEFIMAGRAGPQAEMSAIRQQESRACNFKYLGELSTEDVDRLLSGAHILVSTSEVEGYPNAFIEAWLRRVPVVSLDVDPDGVLDRHGIGIVVDSIAQMFVEVRRLIEQPEVRERMGAAAFEFARENHSLGNLKQLSSMIADLAARRTDKRTSVEAPVARGRV